MSLLKVSLCINRPKQRLLCMDNAGGVGISARPPPGRTKKFFFRCMRGLFAPFFPGEGFMLRFSSDEGLFSSYGGLFATFSLRGGPFCYVFLLVWGLFHNVGAFFAIIFSMWGDFFCLHGGFYVFMVFLWACPFPLQFILRAHAIM